MSRNELLDRVGLSNEFCCIAFCGRDNFHNENKVAVLKACDNDSIEPPRFVCEFGLGLQDIGILTLSEAVDHLLTGILNENSSLTITSIKFHVGKYAFTLSSDDIVDTADDYWVRWIVSTLNFHEANLNVLPVD